MLQIRGLHVHYGAIHALKGLDIEVGEGEVVSIIGSNGAGKSTLLRTVSGLLKPTDGTVELEGVDLTCVEAHEVVAKGIVHCPEGRRIFTNMTVLENLKLGSYLRKDANIDGD